MRQDRLPVLEKPNGPVKGIQSLKRRRSAWPHRDLLVARTLVAKLAANFERNLQEIECFLTEAEAPRAYDALLDELRETVIPNLDRFPDMGWPFLARQTRSIETTNAMTALSAKLSARTSDADALRE